MSSDDDLRRLLVVLGPTIRATEEDARRRCATRDYVVLAGLRSAVERFLRVTIPPFPGDLATAACPRRMAVEVLVAVRASAEVLGDLERPVEGDEMVVVVLDDAQLGVVRTRCAEWAEMFPGGALDGPVFENVARGGGAAN